VWRQEKEALVAFSRVVEADVTCPVLCAKLKVAFFRIGQSARQAVSMTIPEIFAAHRWDLVLFRWASKGGDSDRWVRRRPVCQAVSGRSTHDEEILRSD
jgi:hypothetical protein